MSYRCEICHAKVGPKVARRTHAIKRPNGDTERELSCCPTCAHLLDEGMPFAIVLRQRSTVPRPKPTIPNPPRRLCPKCHGKRYLTDGTLTIACPGCARGREALPKPRVPLAPPAVPVTIVRPPDVKPTSTKIKGKAIKAKFHKGGVQ